MLTIAVSAIVVGLLPLKISRRERIYAGPRCVLIADPRLGMPDWRDLDGLLLCADAATRGERHLSVTCQQLWQRVQRIAGVTFELAGGRERRIIRIASARDPDRITLSPEWLDLCSSAPRAHLPRDLLATLERGALAVAVALTVLDSTSIKLERLTTWLGSRTRDPHRRAQQARNWLAPLENTLGRLGWAIERGKLAVRLASVRVEPPPEPGPEATLDRQLRQPAPATEQLAVAPRRESGADPRTAPASSARSTPAYTPRIRLYGAKPSRPPTDPVTPERQESAAPKLSTAAPDGDEPAGTPHRDPPLARATAPP